MAVRSSGISSNGSRRVSSPCARILSSLGQCFENSFVKVYRRARHCAVTALLALTLFSNSSVIAKADRFDHDYWRLPQFLEAHPEQIARTKSFERRVRAPGISPTIEQHNPIQVFIVYPGLQQSDYWRRSVDSFTSRLDELGLRYEIVERFTKPGTDLRLQGTLIQEVIRTSPDYLIFTLDALRHRGMIDQVHNIGKTKIILQNITTPLRAFDDRQPFLYVGFDHLLGTRILADEYKRRFPDGARYAVLFGPKGYVSQMRGDTFIDEMEHHKGMELRASYYVNFDRARAEKATRDLLSKEPDLDFIYACSTDIALGVIDAIEALGRQGEVLVNGWGGGSNELDALRNGSLAFSVMRMNDDNGVAMAEAISLDLQQMAETVPTMYSGEIVQIDQTLTDTDLQALKSRAFRYSN